MQQQPLVSEIVTINPRDYFVKRPRDAKKTSRWLSVRYRGELVNQLFRGKVLFNTL